MMEPRTLEFFAKACAGALRHGSPRALAQRVCTDSRKVQAGDLFVALEGEHFDGHQFLPEVLAKRVAGVVVRREKAPPARGRFGMIVVPDTRKALGLIAAKYRGDFTAPVIAVGGSNGKTTTKELIASVLGEKLNVLKSEASFNNDVGLPLTLVNLERIFGAVVVELGTNHPGELAPLVKMAKPRFGVVTSLGREHLEFFGDLEGVAREEGWLAELLPADGKLFLGADSPHVESLVARTKAKVVRVGLNRGHDWRATRLQPDAQGTCFHVTAPKPELSGEYRVNLLGRHQVSNALLALALGAEFGLDRAALAEGLLTCQPPKFRMQVVETSGVKLLNDAYNANADSMRAALTTLREFPCKGRRVAVLGDMGELGDHSPAAHDEIGRFAVQQGVRRLITVGSQARLIASAARAEGMKAVTDCASAGEAAAVLKDFLRVGDVVLIKASRAMRLERIAELLAVRNN